MRQSAVQNRGRLGVFLFALCLLAFGSCKQEVIVVEDNDAPFYDEVPTIKIENYVNKLYIDLVGREPLNDEMDADVQLLKDNDLAFETRDEIITRLQTDTTYREGDISYTYAYYHRMYELQKARILESVSNSRIQQDIGIARNGAYIDSLLGNMVGYEKKMKTVRILTAIIDSEEELMLGVIEIDEMCARMLDNKIYDKINMNSFNFINAAFDDLLARAPTQAEFDQSYQMVEFNAAGIIFQRSGQNKGEFVKIITEIPEFYEGFIRWAYRTLLARDATTDEVSEIMHDFWFDHDIKSVQRAILRTDEYANF